MWLILASLFSSSLWASQPQGHLHVHSDNRYDNGYSSSRYHQVLDHVVNVYSPIVEAEGGVFAIQRDWSDGAVNMWAERSGPVYMLEVPGGMARYHLITEEGFILSLCHEIGHLLGGAPKSLYISYEGQGDYYASHTCMALVLKNFPPEQPPKIDSEVQEICGQDLFCSRVLQGAKSLTSYYAELERVPAPKLKTPSTIKVSKTLTSHPPSQCRLDTFYAGLMKKARPACWYKETP